MNKGLIKYTRQCIITLKDGSEIQIPQDKVNPIMDIWNRKGIVNLGNQVFDSVMISKISESFGAPDLSELNSSQQKQLQARIKKFKDNIGREPVEETIYEWFLKLKRGETL